MPSGGGEILPSVINNVIRADGADQLEVLRAADAGDIGSIGLGDLDGERDVGRLQGDRSVVVNLRAVDRIVRNPNETADIHLKGRPEILPVSRSYLHLFRQM